MSSTVRPCADPGRRLRAGHPVGANASAGELVVSAAASLTNAFRTAAAYEKSMPAPRWS